MGCSSEGQRLVEHALGHGHGHGPGEHAAGDGSAGGGPSEPGCALDVCAGECADLETDPGNCGSCGHDCLGGACSAGVCEAVTLAEGDFGAALAVATPDLFLVEATSNAVVRLPREGGATEPFAALPPLTTRVELVADAEHLFAALTFRQSETEVWRLPLSGGGFSDAEGGLLLGEPPDTGRASIAALLETNGTDLVMLEERPSPSNSTRNVIRYDTEGGSAGVVIGTLTPMFNDGFAIDESRAYAALGFESTFDISAVPLAGGARETLAQLELPELDDVVSDVDLSGDSLVYASSAFVARLPKTGGESVTLAVMEGDERAYRVLADGDEVYYATRSGSCANGSKLYRVPLAGGTPVQLANEPLPGCIDRLLSDADALYWMNPGDPLADDPVRVRTVSKR